MKNITYIILVALAALAIGLASSGAIVGASGGQGKAGETAPRITIDGGSVSGSGDIKNHK